MSKIIFLDIDGVICTHRGKASQGLRNHDDYLEPTACDLVFRLIEEFDAQVVISSTWRKNGEEYVREAFDSANQSGITEAFHFIWATPENGKSRGYEIQEWLYKEFDIKEPEAYLILDDDSDMLESQKPHLVLTNGYNGISFGDYLKARQILGATDFKPDHDHLFKWDGANVSS